METQPAAPYGSLAQSARSQELKKAKGILWAVGILTILYNLVMFFTAADQLDKEINKELVKNGTSLEQVLKLPDDRRAEFDAERQKALGRVRLLFGGSVVLGALFIVCALAVNRKPVAATVTGLVLYLAATAAFVAIDPQNLMQGLIIKIFIIIGLVSSVKAALAIEKQDRALQPA
jgi:hypothetical protein